MQRPDPLSSDSSAHLSYSGGTVSGRPELVAQAVAIDREMASACAQWIEHLRRHGIKAAHPDDGWVDRDENKIHLCYPYFNDGLGVGDLLALGRPSSGARVVRIIGTAENRFAIDHDGPWYWHFEDEQA